MILLIMMMLLMMLMMTTPVNEVANPGTKDENGNRARQPVHSNQLEAVWLKFLDDNCHFFNIKSRFTPRNIHFQKINIEKISI